MPTFIQRLSADARRVSDLLPIAVLVLIALGVWAWFVAMHARERATALCAQLCFSHDLQFLDGSVSLVAVRPARSPDGRLRWRRVYQFEFSRGGYDRRRGRISLLGARIDRLELEHPPPSVT